MKEIKLLHKRISTACPKIHDVRLNALAAAVTSSLTGRQVTVTGLGRDLKSYSSTDTKHDIKRMDRLIGNKHLHDERKDIYQYLARLLIGQQKHPVLIVDWSPIPGNELFQLHRISIPMGGRTLTIYEECFEEASSKRNCNQLPWWFLWWAYPCIPLPWLPRAEQRGINWSVRMRLKVHWDYGGNDSLNPGASGLYFRSCH